MTTTTQPMTHEEQHQRDLETLERLESTEYQCFFCAMAELHAQREQERLDNLK